MNSRVNNAQRERKSARAAQAYIDHLRARAKAGLPRLIACARKTGRSDPEIAQSLGIDLADLRRIAGGRR
jgi:hypothetical protein